MLGCHSQDPSACLHIRALPKSWTRTGVGCKSLSSTRVLQVSCPACLPARETINQHATPSPSTINHRRRLHGRLVGRVGFTDLIRTAALLPAFNSMDGTYLRLDIVCPSAGGVPFRRSSSIAINSDQLPLGPPPPPPPPASNISACAGCTP